jgi:hypothetical protein
MTLNPSLWITVDLIDIEDLQGEPIGSSKISGVALYQMDRPN